MIFGDQALMNLRFIMTLTFSVLFWISPPLVVAQGKKDRAERDKQRYYQNWLKETVVYIISPEEKEVFGKLATSEERDQFIEQFWRRRDPDPKTAANEFKEEHYRRIAYANENYQSGLAGWKTDRGRVYIIYGPPDQREAYPTGGNYQRADHEGGGFTSVYPFERWWYRNLPGGRSDIELEFIDPKMSNEYYLAVSPEEKDALLNSDGLGPTTAEEFGLRAKKDRPYFVSNYGEPYPGMNTRSKDDPMRRYETYFDVQKPPPLKYPDLKDMVKVNVTYTDLPFQVRQDYFKLGEGQILAPVTIQFKNKDLTWAAGAASHSIRVAVYGILTTLTNRVALEFEDVVSTDYRPEEMQQGLLERSMYQKIIPIQSNMRYRLDLVVKDLNSGKVGTISKALIPPVQSSDRLEASSLVLAEFIQTFPQTPQQQMFILGDVKVRPSIDKVFLPSDPLGVYLQLYNFGLDQSTLAPVVQVTYSITGQGRVVREVIDRRGESTQFYSDQRLVLIKGLSLKGLNPGEYVLKVHVRDGITQKDVSLSSAFTVDSKQSHLASSK
jgi:GWxTD domain-containing protein